MFRNDLVFVIDVDGILTPGNFFYTRNGKFAKEFGSDDWDLLRVLMKFMKVVFITADKKGFDVVKKRIVDEMDWQLEFVSHYSIDRWNWIKDRFKEYNIIFMGDGCFDYVALSKCYYGITTKDALAHVQGAASLVIERSGGQRAVAEACIKIMDMIGIDWKKHVE